MTERIQIVRKIKFVKMHGAGNDFVLVDDLSGEFPVEDHRRIAAMCSRPDGIGCEGLILVQKSDSADFKMRFFNPDGTEADLCGNGARCVTAFARDTGAAKSDVMVFETAAGLVHAEILESGKVRVEMPPPHDFADDFVVAGVPHKIVCVENLAKTDVEGEGRRIRNSGEFAPDGTNVDFVTYRAPNHVNIRTYERGVESETGACGTGSVAAAVIGVRDYGLEFPVNITTWHGYELVVDGKCSGDSFSDISLTGPVKRLFSGEFDFDSLDPVFE